MQETQAFWEDLYTTRANGDRIWSGRVNAVLASVVDGFTPGRALDLGCGEGGDAVHLARAGWQVTAVDVSPTALARTTEHAAEAGVADRVTTEHHDLSETFPEGDFDLVVASFFQSPLDFAQAPVIRRAAAALAVDGRLVMVEHGSAPTWSEHHEMQFKTPEELVVSLELDPATHVTETVEGREREASGPHGEHGTLLDTVVVVRRTA